MTLKVNSLISYCQDITCCLGGCDSGAWIAGAVIEDKE